MVVLFRDESPAAMWVSCTWPLASGSTWYKYLLAPSVRLSLAALVVQPSRGTSLSFPWHLPQDALGKLWVSGFRDGLGSMGSGSGHRVRSSLGFGPVAAFTAWGFREFRVSEILEGLRGSGYRVSDLESGG